MTRSSPWVVFWQQHALPILQASKEQLAALRRRGEQARPADIVALILSDPLLFVQVLRFANQRPKSSLAADIIAIEHAVMLLGVVPFLERCVQLPALETLLQGKLSHGQLLNLIARARLAQRLAREFSILRNDAYPEELDAAAMLGVLPAVLAELGPVLQAPPQGETGLADLLHAWQIPSVLHKLCIPEELPSERARLQHKQHALVQVLEQGWWVAGVGENLSAIAAILNRDPEEIWQRTVRIGVQFIRQDWRYPQIAIWPAFLPMQPGEWPKPASSTQTQPAAQAAEAPRDILAERLQALHLAAQQATATNQIMSLAMRALVEGLKLPRIAFILLQPEEQMLKVRYAHGFANGDPMRALAVSLKESSLFSQLLQKPQSIWLSPEQYPRYAPHLPPSFRALGSEPCCLMSIFVGNKPLGLIYGDCHGQQSLGERHYTYFKQVCTLTSRALTRFAQR
ncbi:GAF domain-containing protein [Chitinilyticum litopenaei]|uniref:GAF domain-containing protein n=1 Tax=Chitinilyticum litopenaei TaxID=1121276 RepID=UPI00041FC9D9|nr:GAF domain-containing protein [Chitinilyticum litopenaei]